MKSHLFGITGGIGSGKSSVAARLRARGLPVISADELARTAVGRGTPTLAAVVAAFGEGVLTQTGELDRPRVGDLVFADRQALERLNAIVHPEVQRLKSERLRELEAEGHPLVAYDVPLLFEAGLERALRPVVVVSARPEQQIERVIRRDGQSRERVVARMSAQWPLSRKVELADYVIDNSGSLENTLSETDRLLAALSERFGVDPGRYALDRAAPGDGRA